MIAALREMAPVPVWLVGTSMGTVSTANAGLVGDFPRAPRRELLTFTGGTSPESGPCEARSPHGYLDLELEVVKAIADWIAAAR